MGLSDVDRSGSSADITHCPSLPPESPRFLLLSRGDRDGAERCMFAAFFS